MRRFFIDIPSLEQEQITLPPDESKHAAKVLRMAPGDRLEIVNGTGAIFTGEVFSNEPKKVTVKKLNIEKIVPDSYHLHIAIAPTKSNDRFEWFLEKATELGVHEITPLLCENAERKKIKPERFQRIIISAMKQSKRLFLPKFNEFIPYKKFLELHPNGLIAHCYEDHERNTTIEKELTNNSNRWKNKNTPILIGPEGDFTINEVNLALKNGYQAVTLGKTRLRTETAGVYACMNLKLFFEKNL